MLIICGDEFLVLRGWLGVGDWILPGGGLHRGEDPLQGALREVREETGIELTEKDMTFLGSHTHLSKGISFTYEAFVVELQSKPSIRSQRHEIADHAWQALDGPFDRLSSDAAAVVADWKSHK